MGYDPAVVAEAYRAAKAAGATPKIMLALFEAGIVESGMRNLEGGDRDSVGFLQQRASQGWKGLRNVTLATQEFVARAKQKDSTFITPGMLAQRVQVSAFPLKYDAVAPLAIALVTKAQGGFGLDDLTLIDEAAAGVTNPLDQVKDAVGAARSALAMAAAAGAWIADRDNWIRVAKVTAGTGMVFVGLAMLAGPKTLSGAVSVLPVGKGLKAVSALGGAAGKTKAA